MTAPTPNTITAFDEGVRERLKAKIANTYTIDTFPDDVASYKLTNLTGAFLSAYRGADYGPIDETQAIVQERTMLLDINCLSRQMSGPTGAYTMLEMARVALAGYRVPGFSKISIARERFVSRNAAVWIYALTVRAKTLAIEVPDDEVLPTLARLTVQSAFNIGDIT